MANAALREYSISELCRGHWRELLGQLGGVDGRLLTGKHCPCPICGGKDRFRFDDKEGRGTWICSQCRAGDGISLLQKLKGWDFVRIVEEVQSVVGTMPVLWKTNVPDARAVAAEKYRQVRDFWASGQRVADGDAVDRYLRGRLGRSVRPFSLRSIEATPFGGRTHPAMVVAYVDQHGDLAGVQRTFLTEDGRKLPRVESARWNSGTLPDGGAVRLTKPEKIMGIAEGVETALAAAILFGVPCWSALTANRLRVWQPPEGVTEVVIFGDNDANSTGQAAAYALSERLSKSGLLTQVMVPEIVGTDWADVIQTEAFATPDNTEMLADR